MQVKSVPQGRVDLQEDKWVTLISQSKLWIIGETTHDRENLKKS